MNVTVNSNRALQLLTGMGLLVISSCSSGEKKEIQTSADTVVLVTTGKPSAGTEQGVAVSGQVEAEQSANISTRIMGYITRINVEIGDHVSKGQLLATISSDDIIAKRAQADAMIAEADAGYTNAKKDYDRYTILYKQQSASDKELDNVSLQYHSAKERLEAAKQIRNEVNVSLNYTSLTAPFSGTVTQKMVNAGSMANPGMPILTIEENSSYLVSALVPESEISLIHEGASVAISINALNRVINGRVAQISHSSANTGGLYIIKVHIPAEDKQGLFAGMYANLVIPAAQMSKTSSANEHIMVPISAIEYRDQLTGLYTIGSNHAALLRWVRLGKTNGSQVEVLSGLSANEQFIVSAEGRLYNGVVVKIK